jgi:hypothetical protein
MNLAPGVNLSPSQIWWTSKSILQTRLLLDVATECNWFETFISSWYVDIVIVENIMFRQVKISTGCRFNLLSCWQYVGETRRNQTLWNSTSKHNAHIILRFILYPRVPAKDRSYNMSTLVDVKFGP